MFKPYKVIDSTDLEPYDIIRHKDVFYAIDKTSQLGFSLEVRLARLDVLSNDRDDFVFESPTPVLIYTV